MIVTVHSAESLTSFDSGVRFTNGAERPQQAVFKPLMITLVMIVGHKLCDRVAKRRLSEEDHPIQTFFLDGTDKSLRERV
jgi:hypothetical protein